jgi:peptidoglycan-associated lipoprotein
MSHIKRVFAPLAASLLAMALLAGCGPKYPNCDTDQHCAEHGEVCVDGACKQCRDKSQCPAACDICGPAGSCVKESGCCTSDLDCATGQKCWMTGQTGQCGAACSVEHPCPAGQKCIGSSCVPDVECTGDSGCAQGQKCVDGSCVAGCEIRPATFDFDEYVLTSEAQQLLRENAECMRTKPGSAVVEGHCDERGTDEYNLALGQRRANSVKRALKGHGIPNSRLRTISYGEERPVCHEHNESCWWRNRRAEINVQ